VSHVLLVLSHEAYAVVVVTGGKKFKVL